MDGKFVPTRSIDFNFKVPECRCQVEAHLMVEDASSWVSKHGKKADTILAHIESCKDPKGMVNQVRAMGKRIGFALNPKTPIERIKEVLDDVDEVLIMTVNPGYYGSPFLPETLEKVRKLREIMPTSDIEVDGGISPLTLLTAKQAGANYFVCGSYIQKSGDISKAAKELNLKIGKI